MRQSVVLSTAVVVCILGGALLVATRGCASNPEPHPEADDGQVPAHRPEARRTRERANPSLHEPKRPDEHPSVAIAAATAPARPESATAKIAVSCGDHAVTHCRFATSLRPTDYLVIRQSPESESYEVAFPAGQHFPVTVIAYAKGFEPAEVTIDARGASVRVALPEGGTVTGRVVDAAGAPLPDGRVFLAGRQATITAGGAFRLLGVKLGEHEEFFVESGGTICPIEHSVILDAPGDSCEVELVWRADAPFDVHVVMKDDGSPVPGVTVRLSATDLMASAVASATSDVEGRVTIVGLPPGEYWCWAFGDAIDPAYVERVRVPTEAPVLLRVSSPTYHRIFGRVVDRNRRPLPGVRMSWGSEYGVVTSTTDRNGAFELKDVREIPWPTQVVSAVPPPVVIRAFRRGRDALAAMPTSFEVKWDTELELVLGEPSTWIGVVEGPPGRELPGFDLILRTSDGATYAANFRDNDDRSERKFAWGNAPGVPGVLEVRTLDGRSLQMPVTPPADGGRFDLGRLRLPVGGRLALTAGTAAELSGRAWVAWLDASAGSRTSLPADKRTRWSAPSWPALRTPPPRPTRLRRLQTRSGRRLKR